MWKMTRTYGAGWLAWAGCAAAIVSLLLGDKPARWELYFWVGIVAVWVANYMLATRTGQMWKRERDSERQRNRSMWS